MLKINYSFLTAVRRLQTVMIWDLNMLKAKTFKSKILNFWYLEKGFFFLEKEKVFCLAQKCTIIIILFLKIIKSLMARTMLCADYTSHIQ